MDETAIGVDARRLPSIRYANGRREEKSCQARHELVCTRSALKIPWQLLLADRNLKAIGYFSTTIKGGVLKAVDP